MGLTNALTCLITLSCHFFIKNMYKKYRDSNMVLTMMVNINLFTLMKAHFPLCTRLATRLNVHGRKHGVPQGTIANLWLHKDTQFFPSSSHSEQRHVGIFCPSYHLSWYLNAVFLHLLFSRRFTHVREHHGRGPSDFKCPDVCILEWHYSWWQSRASRWLTLFTIGTLNHLTFKRR